MTEQKFVGQWTKQDTVKSAWLFFLHFAILTLIASALLLGPKLGVLKEYMKEHGANYLYALFCVFLLTAIMYFYFFFEDKVVLSSGRNIALIFTVLEICFVLSWLIGEKIDVYARPVALIALLIFVLVDRRSAIFMNIVSALLLFVVDTFTGTPSATAHEYYSSLIIAFSAGMIAIFFCNKAKTRVAVVGIGIFIVLPIDLIIFLLEISTLLDYHVGASLSTFQSLFMRMGYGLFGGVMSTVIFLAILPVFEGIFNCLTVFRLRELTSFDAKILKNLKQEAPGTYNHSVMVSQLAEACAAAIGENVDYARAAALYHDVGKLHNPEHFTENQGDYNLHDELTPELSADIIRSHAKDGYTLIRAHHLPEFLADVAIQHHGTMPGKETVI